MKKNIVVALFIILIITTVLFFAFRPSKKFVRPMENDSTCGALTGYEDCCLDIVNDSNSKSVLKICNESPFFLFYAVTKGDIGDCSRFDIENTTIPEFEWSNNYKEEMCEYVFLQFNSVSGIEIDSVYQELISACISSGNSELNCSNQISELDINSEKVVTPIKSIKAFRQGNISLCHENLPEWEERWCTAILDKNLSGCYPCGLP